jgi:hypothetical protein
MGYTAHITASLLSQENAIMTKWKHIDTAPTNGEHILARCLEDHIQLVYHDVRGWKSVITDKYVIPETWFPEED